MSRLALIFGIGTALIGMYDGYCLVLREASQPVEQKGIASWYGRAEQGKPTADGETFDRHKFTAAHRHLPFNTIVRVTNERNGRSVNVRINDRGPYAKGRVLDLSEAAADSLDMIKSGIAPVRIEVINPSSAP